MQLFSSLLFGEPRASPLAPPNRALLIWLLDLMAEVVKSKELNRMNARAVATCFAPSLYVLEEPLPPESVQVIKNVSSVLANSLAFLNAAAVAPRDVYGDLNAALQDDNDGV